jgi:hypothetical protein
MNILLVAFDYQFLVNNESEQIYLAYFKVLKGK